MSCALKVLGLALLTSSSSLLAQNAPKEILAEAVDKAEVKFAGWDSFLGLALNGTMIQNKDVVGKEEGQTTTLGLKLEGELDYKNELALWKNSFTALTAYSRTPLLGEYVKSDDQLKAESLYKRLFAEESRFGSFGRLQLETSFFPGYSNQAEPKDFIISKADGSLVNKNSERLLLTDAFRPVKLAESLGLFSNILNAPALTLDMKAGLGLRQVFAKGQLAAADADDTPEFEVKELSDYRKAGYELGSEMSGTTADKRVSYKLTANVLFPFYESPSDDSDDRSSFDKRIVDVNGKVSFYLVQWASLDYVASALRDPNLVAKTQISQSFLFSTQYVFSERRKD